MKINYNYRSTVKINQTLEKLSIKKQVFDLLPRFPQIELNLKRQSLLKSSLFSARIEGNPLELNQLGSRSTKDLLKLEVFNILDALNWLYSKRSPKELNLKMILKLHGLVFKNIKPCGNLRKEPSAIFNQAGVAIYLAPPPDEVPQLLSKLITQINQSTNLGSVKAAILHFAFEKIHPFLDGNGRVGRLLSTFILKQSGFGFRGLVSFEEYLENHRSIYYDLLANNQKDITQFVEFFLIALDTKAQQAIKNIKTTNQETPEDSLMSRRKEILQIIRDHRLVSFNFIQRRFLSISSRSLHYDLKHLISRGFIKKEGITKGALYFPV
ncbi:MAG: Fic family protein [Candidatus Beckwithbacteria bacterium]